MDLQHEISADGKVLTIKLPTMFGVAVSKQFKDAYQNNIDTISTVILDMEETELVDSSGMGMILMLKERMGGDDADLSMTNISPGVEKLFKRTGLYSILGGKE